MSSLAADHASCAAVLERAGSSFALPIRLLPAAKRRGTQALYAFCRRADDLVDDAVDESAARRTLAAFAAETRDAVAGLPVGDPVLRALADTVRRFAVPVEHVHAVLDGVRMDLERQSYDTAAELDDYCRKVASAVGLAAIHIWGHVSSAALPAADACGLAFQLTNILRDVPEDLDRGRIYLPGEDFAACACTPDDLRVGRIGEGFARLAARLVARAEGHYARAARLDPLLCSDSRGAFRAMFGVYRALLGAVRRAGPGIFATRVRPGRPRLAAAAAVTVALGPSRVWGLGGAAQ